MASKNWNPEQLAAITSLGGNLLVSAAAGSGKTAVLVERVIRMLTDPVHPVDADRLLVVTFTNLAAAEMKSRINAALAELSAQSPADARLSRQQLLMERAHISTIHAFCLDVIRENFSALGLPPDSRIADDREAEAISDGAMEEALESYYQSGSAVFSELVETLGGGRSDAGLEEAVLTLHSFIRALPHYEDWLSEKAAMYDPEIPPADTVWGRILLDYAASVLSRGISSAEYMLRTCAENGGEPYCPMFGDDVLVLKGLLARCESGGWDDFRKALTLAAFGRMPSVRGFDGPLKDRISAARKEYKDSVKKLAGIFSASEADFREDVADLYPKINCLFALTMDYDRLYSEKKRENRVLDFSDLEQLTLAVLSEKTGDGRFIPTPAAKAISKRFDYILVDECQDINKAQDTIFEMISGGGNLFFVGDVKQSIYRFRQAMPELFLEKRRSWPLFDGEHYPATIILGRNYRSRKSIAGAVNCVFRQIMSEKAAEMDYGPEEMLIPEASFPEDGITRNELLLVEAPEGDSAKAEAAAVAEHIYNMVLRAVPVQDGGATRPVRYSDICILLRSMKNQGDIFVSALRERGIACRSEHGSGFLSQPEVAAVLDVLKAADNPLLDLPLTGAMLSEMFLFTPDELAEIRLLDRSLPLFSAAKLSAEGGDAKAANFLKVLSEIRRFAAFEPADAVIERLYSLTSYPQIMRGCENGELRLANLRLLVKYAADREAAGCHGLSAFLRFVSRLEERGDDLAPAGCSGFGGSCVRIMSVHGSKGLEFPVVCLCGTGRKFNFDVRADKPLLHPKLGFACPRRDKETGIRFATVPQEALKIELRRLSLAEEMRILYVAMTRAKENLIITCAKRDAGKYLSSLAPAARGGGRLDPFCVSSAQCEADWLFTALLRHPDAADLRAAAGLEESCVVPDETRWNFSVVKAGASAPKGAETPAESPRAVPDRRLGQVLSARARWRYPYAAAEKIPVKAGVSSLTHQEMHEKLLFGAKPTGGALSGAERGTALHTFMQFCDFDLAKADPAAEIARLLSGRFITEKQAGAIDPEKVRAFFTSALYGRIERSPFVRRELRFLQSLPAADLGYEGASPEDKITVQGVADCVFEDGGELFVLDYKTDYVEDIEELRSRYSAQLVMYESLLSEALGRPVAGAVIWSFRFGRELWI